MYRLLRSLLFQLEPENAHSLVALLSRVYCPLPLIPGLLDKYFYIKNDKLKINLWGINFPNPVGIAAGLDKNATLHPFFHHLGFSFTEIGTITNLPWTGNPKPRIFRLPSDEAIINRMGLCNLGAQKISKTLSINRKYPIGINIAKTPDYQITGDESINDFIACYQALSPFADYITLNISCPNTEEGKTFEDPATLDNLLQKLVKYKTTPLLIKLSSDLADSDLADSDLADSDLANCGPGSSILTEIISVAQQHQIDGYVIANTSTKRDGLNTPMDQINQIGKGGLSGKPIRSKSTKLIKMVYQVTNGKTPIIGVGGIDSAETAYQKIKAGASLLQLFTGFIYQGPTLARKINLGLLKLLKQDGFEHLKDAIGTE